MSVKEGLKNKRGQVTIFIIIAILVVALAFLAYLLIPKLRSNVSQGPQTPSEFINECMKEKISETVELVSILGGNVEPEFYYAYLGDPVTYLCYTNEYWKPCINQQPFLKEHIKSEIQIEIQESVDACFASMVLSFEERGYEVVLENANTNSVVDVLPERISVIFENEITLTKGESQTYDLFYVILDSNLYELLSIAENIVLWEMDTGDSITETYMLYDPYIKVEKRTRTDETRLYILTDRRTEEVFRFAIRSYAIPPGLS